jgi:hypothetical protein
VAYQLSHRIAKAVEEAYAEGQSDRAVIARLKAIYLASDVVERVDVDSIGLSVTYRGREDWPEGIILPARPKGPPLTKEERRARRDQQHLNYLLELKQALEGGSIVLVLPTERVMISPLHAGSAQAAIEAYRRSGDSGALANYIPQAFWRTLREPLRPVQAK